MHSTGNKVHITLIFIRMPGSSDKRDHRIEIDEWRKKIDSIDQKLAALLCERLHCAKNISSLKSALGEQVLQPEREKEVLNNVMNHADTPLISQALEKIYRCILEESRLLQQEWKSFHKETSSQ